MAFTKVVGPGIHTLSNITSHNIHSSGIVTATRFDGPFTNLNVTGVTTFAGDVSIGGTLTYEDVTNIDSVGLITARNGINVSAGNVTIAKDIDVDGHTNLDNVSVAGVTTFASGTVFTGSIDANGDLDVDGHTNLDHVSIAGVVTASTINATLFNGPSQVGIQSGGVQIGAGVTQLNFIGLGNTFAVNGTTVDVSISGNSGAGGTWSSYTAGIATTKSVGINTNNLDDNDLVGVGNSFQGLYISNGMMITDNKLSGNHYIGTAFNGLMAGPVTVEGTLTIDGNYVVV